MLSVTIEQYPVWVNRGQWLNLGVVNAAKRPTIDNKKTAIYQKRKDINPNDVIGRGGVVALGGTSTALANQSHNLLWVTGSMIMAVIGGSGWTSGAGTFAQGEYCAQQFPLVGFEGYEFAMEGAAVDAGVVLYDYHVFAQGFYQKRKAMYNAASRSYPSCGGNYGSFDMYSRIAQTGFKVSGSEVSPTNSVFKGLYASKSAARTSCDYLINNRDSIYDANVRWYPYDFQYARHFYTVGHEMEIMKKGSNGKVYLFTWPLIEQVTLDGFGNHTLHNGHNYERRVSSPAGLYRTGEHPVADFDFFVAQCLFWGYMEGDGIFGWDNPQLFGANPNIITPPNPNPTPERAAFSEWIPDVPGTPAPCTGNSLADIANGYPELPIVHQDAIFVAEHLYQTMFATSGVAFEHAPYTVTAQKLAFNQNFSNVNVSRSLQSDGSTLLFDAAANDGFWSTSGRRGRGVLKARTKTTGGASYYSAAYFDPSLGKHQYEKIKPVIGGVTFPEIVVQGGVVTVFNGQL